MRTAVQITETLHLLDLLCGFTAGLSYPITSGFCNNPPIAVEWSSREADDCEIKTHTFPTIQSVPWRRKWPKPVSRTSPQICVDVLVLSRYDSVLAIASTGMCAGVRDMTSAEACGTQWAYSATRMAAFWEQLQKVLVGLNQQDVISCFSYFIGVFGCVSKHARRLTVKFTFSIGASFS